MCLNIIKTMNKNGATGRFVPSGNNFQYEEDYTMKEFFGDCGLDQL